MNRFGQKLKTYLTSNDCTVYHLSKGTGIERTGLHRAISGQRLPAEDSLDKIMDFLHLTQKERDELLEAYAIDSVGEDAYYQRMLILHLIQSLSLMCRPQGGQLYVDKQVEITSNAFSDHPLFLRGKYQIANFIRICMEHTFYQSDSCTYLFTPLCREFPEAAIPFYAPAIFPPSGTAADRSGRLAGPGQRAALEKPSVRHLVSFSRPESGGEAVLGNLENLNAFLPLCLGNGLDYQIFYYYGNLPAENTGAFILPYYVITGRLVIFLSEDLQTACIQSDPELVAYCRCEFEKRLELFSRLIHAFSQPFDLYRHCLSNTDIPSGRNCFIEYEPCFFAFADQEIIDRILPQTLPPQAADRKVVHDFTQRRIQWLQDLDSPVWLFTAEGLRYFMETGISTDLPPDICLPVPEADRLTLLKRLKSACECGRQRIRLIHTRHFPLPEFTAIIVNEYAGIDFYLYDGRHGSQYLSVDEHTLTNAFLDFAEGLLDSPLVYGEQETVRLLEQTIQAFTPAP